MPALPVGARGSGLDLVLGCALTLALSPGRGDLRRDPGRGRAQDPPLRSYAGAMNRAHTEPNTGRQDAGAPGGALLAIDYCPLPASHESVPIAYTDGKP